MSTRELARTTTTTTTTRASENVIRTVNPATGQVIDEYPITTKEQIDHKVKRAKEAFQEWKRDHNKRRDFLYELAHVLRKSKEELARIATTEMGKPIKEARSEVEKCVRTVQYFADNMETFTKEQVINTDARNSIVKFQPIELIASIMPWNFPYWQALRFAAPSMVLGNTIILKPASATTLCGIKIEEKCQESGGPEGVFQTIVGSSKEAENLIDSPEVNAVTFTGSVSAGAKVAQRAASQIKKCVLELGGSDPFVVCEDADIEKASTGAVKGRFVNCGQSCIASKRFIVTKSVANEFKEKFIQKTEKLRVGDPLDDNTDIGPLVNINGLETIEAIVKDSTRSGAELYIGGNKIGDEGGCFYEPTILGKVEPRMRIAQEEVFGPVAPIIIVENEADAIHLANKTPYGLGASLWTKNLGKAESYSDLIDAGVVTVNNIVASDPRVPFGGVKKSGFGRELSRYGMLEFANIKSVRFYDELVHYHHVE
jgi:succinate-semialdehyde dehydrogenase/glutarate-semialdehyde dehydrogenase/succinyl-CoA reductase